MVEEPGETDHGGGEEARDVRPRAPTLANDKLNAETVGLSRTLPAPYLTIFPTFMSSRDTSTSALCGSPATATAGALPPALPPLALFPWQACQTSYERGHHRKHTGALRTACRAWEPRN